MECGLKQHPFHPRLGFSGFYRESPGRLLSYPPQDAILAGEALTICAVLPLSPLPIVLHSDLNCISGLFSEPFSFSHKHLSLRSTEGHKGIPR